jgi:hypothetical protein
LVEHLKLDRGEPAEASLLASALRLPLPYCTHHRFRLFGLASILTFAAFAIAYSPRRDMTPRV